MLFLWRTNNDNVVQSFRTSVETLRAIYSNIQSITSLALATLEQTVLTSDTELIPT